MAACSWALVRGPTGATATDGADIALPVLAVDTMSRAAEAASAVITVATLTVVMVATLTALRTQPYLMVPSLTVRYLTVVEEPRMRPQLMAAVDMQAAAVDIRVVAVANMVVAAGTKQPSRQSTSGEAPQLRRFFASATQVNPAAPQQPLPI